MHKIILILFGLSFTIIACNSQNQEGIYIRIYEGEYDEMGARNAYINEKGDTVIPFGKYQMCYTDTFKKIAIVMTNDNKLIGIDKDENQVYEVFWYDNGPDYVSDGLFRVIIDGKIGYANKEGDIIIKPQFDCAYPFEEGKAKVSKNCTEEKDGEHSRWISDEWYFIDKEGNKIE